MLTGLLGAGLSHEVLHLIPAWVITRQRPTFTAAGSRRVGMTTRGTTTRQEAQLILGAPALLLPAAAVGALMGTGSLRVGWLMALTTLLLGSGSDLHYVRKLSALPSCTLITDRGVAGYALVAQCSACATARRDLEASRKGTGG